MTRVLTLLTVITVTICAAKSLGQEVMLKDAFAEGFLIGTALSEQQPMCLVPEALPLVARQLNSITPENSLNWEKVHPRPDKYAFQIGGDTT
jgi:endo-1,4-beta-xylanase